MIKTLYNLTCPQKSILSMEQFYSNTSVNTICGKITIHSNVDFTLLNKAINLFVKNTNNIRYQLHKDQDIVSQYEEPYTPFNIEHFKLNCKNEENICNTIAHKVFPLYDSPLYYFATFQNEDLTGGFFICVHHIISDAWSLSILINSIISFYSKLIKKETISTVQNSDFIYTNFIEQENNYMQSSKFIKDQTFWNEIFKENTFENSSFQNFLPASSWEATRAEFKLSKKLSTKILNFCSSIKISPFTLILLLMGIYESKIKQSNSIVLSTPILNRCTSRDKNTFGLFINNILYKLDIDESTSFIDTVTQLNNLQFSYLRHQKYPFQNLIEEIKNKFNIKDAIFDTTVSYQNARTNHCQDNVNYDSKWLFNGFSSIPLVFHIYDMDDTKCLSFIYDYQNNVYDYSNIKDRHNRLLYICEQIIDNPNILMKDIEFVTQEEKTKLLKDFNNTYVLYDTKKTVLDLWEKQIHTHPTKTAIICDEKEISYKKLEQLSNQFASILQNQYNVIQGTTIAVILNRSIDLVIALLAILKCGCSYVLIDSSLPLKRKKYMLESSDSKFIISNVSLPFENIISFSSNFNYNTTKNYQKPIISSNDSMYLLFTSGSTGAPKAVTVTHRNFHNYFVGISQIIDYSEDKLVLSMASISFDVFGYELWVTLLHGLTLVLSTDKEQNDFVKLNNLICHNHINILYGTPSKIQSLMSTVSTQNCFSSITDIGIGGEAFSLSFVQNINNICSANLYNMYGPTETTIGCSCKKIEKNTKQITIGKPLANVRFYVLDKNLKLCPPGTKGELYISGDGVSKGYYKKLDLTQKNFITDIFYPQDIMYKSGDMVSWTNNGELVFYGRLDSQVKIRGYRIELHEIERNLNEHPFIKNCCVVVNNSNERDFLCAYYTSDFTMQNYELKLFLANKLPNYMIPSYFICLPNLPLTINGKIDKNKLPSPFDSHKKNIRKRPENELQKNICTALESCLAIKNVSIYEDFNNLGMDSLSIIKIQSQLSALNIKIPTQYFYEYTNIKDLCFALEHTQSQKSDSTLQENYPFLKHNLSKIKTKNNKFKNILLTGCTGFLGVHILENLLHNNCKIFCLIRSSNIEAAKKRIFSMFEFYFKNRFTHEFLLSKIEIVVGDIKYKNLGLSEEFLETLGNKINLVIHCAALVKHIGKYEEFKKMNLDGAKNIAEFCMKYNINLNHISTTSVSGDFMPLSYTSDIVNFTEENLFIGQNYSENYYIKSKLLSEDYLLQQVKQGKLNCNIFRVGNLTGRYSDGVFQYNIDSNSFYNKLQFILKNKFFYESGTLQEFDLSPVDEIASAIISIIYNYGIKNKIFHMMNPKRFNMKTLIDNLNSLGYYIKIIKDADFYKKVIKLDSNTNSFMINDYNLHTSINNLNIKTTCNITLQYLDKIPFSYNEINLDYLSKLVQYMKNIKFI